VQLINYTSFSGKKTLSTSLKKKNCSRDSASELKFTRTVQLVNSAQWSMTQLFNKNTISLGEQHEKQHFTASQNLRCSFKY